MSAPRSPWTHLAQAALAALFALYLGFIVWAVLWKLQVPYISGDPSHALKLVPFVATSDAGRSAPREVLANVALFVPLGAYLRALRPVASWAVIGLTAAVLSSSLEAWQFLTGVGVADISDVISNTGGALVGALLAALLQAAAPRRAGAVMLVTAAVVTCAVGVIVAFGSSDTGPTPGSPGSASLLAPG